jgi:hypothetical protein
MLVHTRTLLAARLLKQEAIATRANEHKTQEQKRIQEGETLSQEDANDIKA